MTVSGLIDRLDQPCRAVDSGHGGHHGASHAASAIHIAPSTANPPKQSRSGIDGAAVCCMMSRNACASVIDNQRSIIPLIRSGTLPPAPFIRLVINNGLEFKSHSR